MSVARYGIYNTETNELLGDIGGPEYLREDMAKSIREQALRIKEKFHIECEVRPMQLCVGDTVEIIDGFALIGERSKISEVSRGAILCYKLEISSCWWPHSQVKLITEGWEEPPKPVVKPWKDWTEQEKNIWITEQVMDRKLHEVMSLDPTFVTGVPLSYITNLDFARAAEKQMEPRGLQLNYLGELYGLVSIRLGKKVVTLLDMARASAEDRCHAMYLAISKEKSDDNS
jgi:hypothetical protein